MRGRGRATNAGSTSTPPGWPLHRYLLAIVALFVTVATVCVVSGWRQAERDALAAARRDAAHAVALAAQQVGDAVAVVQNTVGPLAASPRIGRAFTEPETCQLAFTVEGRPDAGHLDILRADGTVVCSSRPLTGTGPAAYASASWLPGALLAPALTAPVLDARTGRAALLVTAPIPGLGAVAGFVDLAALGAVAGNLFGGARQLEFVLTTADRSTMLTRWPDAERWSGKPVTGTGFAGPVGDGDGRDVDGTPRLYAHANVAGPGWHLYAGAARSPALASAYRLARRQAAIVTIGFLAGLIAVLLVYRRITRPIGRLRTAMHAAAGGAGGAIEPSGPREVGELAAGYNELYIAVDRELAERRRAEEEAREHEQNYRQMFDASPYPMYLFDVKTLAIIEANDAAVTFYGYDHEELLATTAAALAAPDHESTAPDHESTAPDHDTKAPADDIGGRSTQRLLQRHAKRDGTVVEVAVSSYVISFAGQKVRCAVVEDLTERETLERRLRQSQRLESLGQLAGGVAHDFNNLLGIIVGYASMSAAEVDAAARTDPAWRAVHDDLNQIVAAGDRATALTRQLLAFARADPVAQPRVLDLNHVVADIEKLLRRTLGEDIELIVRLTDRPWPVKADPGQLEQVLVNLAVNARDAMPSGGTLTIETEPVDVDATQFDLPAGRYMRLQVVDTGVGMDQATLERAFEPFFTTKPKGHGTGLGLATIYGIITQAGGYVQLESAPGDGTRVCVLLPVTDEPVGADEPTGTTAGPGRGRVVLLVEDDDQLRELTARILTRHGYVVRTAATAAQAHRHAASEPFDLLLTDVVLPGVDGHSLATQLNAVQPAMKVVYVSGYTEPILAARTTLPPGATLLTKPITADQLLAAVDRTLTDRQQHTPA